jgi:hypothetical protein
MSAEFGFFAGKDAGIITKLNGRDTTGLSLEIIRETLHTSDRSNTLTFLRDGKTLEIVLKTREMLP